MSWKRVALLLALVCAYQTYRGCTRGVKKVYGDNCPKQDGDHTYTASGGFDGDERGAHGDTPRPSLPTSDHPTLHAYGFAVTVPPWATMLLPNKGETIKSYKDRMLPLAQRVIAPQRARVARMRDELAKSINLDPRQRGELDGATSETASALENRVMEAFANGAFDPATFKPMTGVNLAKGLLDDIATGNARWQSALSESQKTALAGNPFDFGDYLVFSTPWEDLLKVFD